MLDRSVTRNLKKLVKHYQKVKAPLPKTNNHI